jgi:hypothetical protein
MFYAQKHKMSLFRFTEIQKTTKNMNSFTKQIGVKTLQVLNWSFFILMVFINYLANALPINGKTTKQLSDQYPNLFVPAPITFTIWGIIYSLILIFCIRQSKGFFSKTTDPATTQVVEAIGLRFVITCLLNAAWIVAWHYEHLFFSIIIMVSLLVQLIDINLQVKKRSLVHNIVEATISKIAFGVYLGWICIATIANATAALVFFGWEGFGQGLVFWASLMILVGAAIACYAIIKLKNFYIGSAVIWAFIGILIERIGATEYHRFIVWNTVFAIIIVLTNIIFKTTKSAFQQ